MGLQLRQGVVQKVAAQCEQPRDSGLSKQHALRHSLLAGWKEHLHGGRTRILFRSLCGAKELSAAESAAAYRLLALAGFAASAASATLQGAVEHVPGLASVRQGRV